MGYTNSMQIQHGDLTFLLQDEIPDTAVPFVGDVPVKGSPTHYKTGLNSFETIPENPGICCFVWEHLQNINRILQCIRHAGGTFSAAKSHICIPSAVVVGHLCTYNGCLPDIAWVQKIMDWPVCKSLTEVWGFCKGNWGTRLQENPQFMLQFAIMIQLTVRKPLRGDHPLS